MGAERMMIIFIMALPIMYGLLIHDAVTMPEERLREFEWLNQKTN
jgi:hypothetical protein